MSAPTGIPVLVDERGRVRCGNNGGRCAVVGDLMMVGGQRLVVLREGFRRERDGVYRMHRHAQGRLARGLAPRDAHGRWIGPVRVDAREKWRWGPASRTARIPGLSDAEVAADAIALVARSLGSGPEAGRQRYRERAAVGGLRILCPRCGFVGTGHSA